jgi:hypothetical protein
MEPVLENGWNGNHWLFDRLNSFRREIDEAADDHLVPRADVVEDKAYHFYVEMDLVAGPHVGRHQLALLGHLALAHRHDLALLRLFLGGVQDDDPAPGFLFLLDALDQNPIAQRSMT